MNFLLWIPYYVLLTVFIILSFALLLCVALLHLVFRGEALTRWYNSTAYVFAVFVSMFIVPIVTRND